MPFLHNEIFVWTIPHLGKNHNTRSDSYQWIHTVCSSLICIAEGLSRYGEGGWWISWWKVFEGSVLAICLPMPKSLLLLSTLFAIRNVPNVLLNSILWFGELLSLSVNDSSYWIRGMYGYWLIVTAWHPPQCCKTCSYFHFAITYLFSFEITGRVLLVVGCASRRDCRVKINAAWNHLNWTLCSSYAIKYRNLLLCYKINLPLLWVSHFQINWMLVYLVRLHMFSHS